MKKQSKSDEAVYLRRRRVAGVLSLLAVLLVMGGVTWLVTQRVLSSVRTPEEFRAYIGSGIVGRLVLVGLQILQVVVAFIPGELIEVGAGYAFGPAEGTLLCMAGVAAASSMVFLLAHRLGARLVELFVDRKKIDELRFINSEKKLKRMIFLLFFIPGTPKDLFTYFAGLTRIKLHEFLIISLIARIPSVLSSTMGGHIIGEQNYTGAIWLFAITGAVSLGGMLLYSKLVKLRQGRHKPEHEERDG